VLNAMHRCLSVCFSLLSTGTSPTHFFPPTLSVYLSVSLPNRLSVPPRRTFIVKEGVAPELDSRIGLIDGSAVGRRDIGVKGVVGQQALEVDLEECAAISEGFIALKEAAAYRPRERVLMDAKRQIASFGCGWMGCLQQAQLAMGGYGQAGRRTGPRTGRQTDWQPNQCSVRPSGPVPAPRTGRQTDWQTNQCSARPSGPVPAPAGAPTSPMARATTCCQLSVSRVQWFCSSWQAPPPRL
jgi:hypothetical protein